MLVGLTGGALIARGRGDGGSTQPLSLLNVRGERDISRDDAIESEAALALDPGQPRLLLAGSNVPRGKEMAVFESHDGGARWQTGRLPLPAGACATSDPTLGIAGDHRQYYAFLGLHCRGGHVDGAQVFLATRASASERWRLLPALATRRGRYTLVDDRPFLLVDDGRLSPHRGRLYLGWTRMSVDPNAFFSFPDEVGDYQPLETSALVSHSDDSGRSWSKPVLLADHGSPLEVRLAAGADGTLYAVWREQATGSIRLARSADGSRLDTHAFVAGAVVDPAHSCGGYRARIPAQPRRCVSPNPVVSVDRSRGPRAGHVYVTWGTTSLNRSQDVYVAAFDPQLKPLLGVGKVEQLNPSEGLRGTDQFLPASTVDGDGTLWACYYQSLRHARRAARYACTASVDGAVSWLAPSFVASHASDETLRSADRSNGFGDYEAIAAAGTHVYAVWTDGRALQPRREEIYGARLLMSTAGN